jgi:hypothetical protein
MDHPIRGGYKYGNLTLQVPKMTALMRTSAIINDKTVLSSERTSQINKPATVWQ